VLNVTSRLVKTMAAGKTVQTSLAGLQPGLLPGARHWLQLMTHSVILR
jgi:hypothetical protein